MAGNFRMFLCVILSAFVSSCCHAASSEAEFDLAAKLSALKPLPKIHYSWPFKGNFVSDRDNELLNYLARITHALSISAEKTSEKQIDNFVFVCARINKTTNPPVKCSLGVNFSPWHRKFKKNLPPTDTGPSYHAEKRYFSERLNFVKKCVAESNARYNCQVKVTAVLLDCERFRARPHDPAWNEGIRAKLDEIHKLAESIFPKARIEWFYHGMKPLRQKTGWARTITWTGKEIDTSLSVAFYCLPKAEQMRESYRRTCQLADAMDIEDVTPWVSLASGYQPSMAQPRTYYYDWDYDIEYSHQLGAELNILRFSEQPTYYAPYNRAKIVVFYPPPFDKRTPAWSKHFIAYVRGATGVSELRDLKFKKKSGPKD